jgi:hypothetical protein
MTELQMGLALVGVVLVAGIFLVSRIQEFRHRRLVKSMLPETRIDPLMPVVSGDVLVDPSVLSEEPALGAWGATEEIPRCPSDVTTEFALQLTPSLAIEEAELIEALPGAWLSSPGLEWKGYLASQNQWIPLEAGSSRRFQRLALLAPLATRQGPMSEAALATLVHKVEELALSLGAKVEAPDVAAAAMQAQVLENICAQCDLIIGINVIFPATVQVTEQQVSDFCRDQGLLQNREGAFVPASTDEVALYRLVRQDGRPFQDDRFTDSEAIAGVTFLVDFPRQARWRESLRQVMTQANGVATAFQGRVVDDAGSEFGDEQRALIESRLEVLARKMEGQGFAPGSPLALRLFNA